MVVTGFKKGKTDSKKLNWSETPLRDKEKNHGWSEYAINPSLGIVFQLYYNNDNKGVYLLDVMNDVTYQVPLGAKAKGYVIAFKIFSKM